MTRVLVVDDAAFIRAQLKQLLTQNGFEVVGEAENGQVALRKIKELRPDIVTLDITMPEMDGIECMAEINKLESKPAVIMVSAMGQEPYVQKAILNGARGFIVKPYKPEVVINYLNKFRK
ncbi:response regulator [Defluviitalea raffinosedens]|jgi:two-component system chemotaxis response regulator CheY|uniref:Stage 0 sporulation protein A homolog n=1 Tax=Defluviitalea raffinosedens TaxID=1450156 RepID=A0A7C8HE24_9FIRM|nr:response regulator [Defluviitalea raffinosedens]KAE9631218.1 response regulator [Defluviitalea raffinosedens]MBM7686244.1 two-component system chemotaxis response regulator CheY [Defluviitalea raffinosedens]MBZ4669032.1 cheY6 [Defluviitaleaceae bacterium]HHW68595.1 response regulator [Candidatus Epulonipiscium sp.]